MPCGHAYFDHTADVGIHAWGETLEEAFAEAAVALVAYMVETADAKPVGEARLEVEAETRDRLLYRFLDEVLDLLQTRLYVVTRARVRFEGATRLVADVEGEAYDAARHGHVHEVKAITFHDLHVSERPPDVRVILDI
ncbi:MAG: protein archease [Thermoplasmata archaeon]|jgi:SHS2 domain-containing protein|nr:protein archease [Thermoplasmata archaeon]